MIDPIHTIVEMVHDMDTIKALSEKYCREPYRPADGTRIPAHLQTVADELKHLIQEKMKEVK